jgi:hypothetical protein
LKLNSL